MEQNKGEQNKALGALSGLIGGDIETVFWSMHDSLAEGVVCCDDEGRVVYANQGFLNCCGYDYEEIKGKKIYEFLFHPDSEQLRHLSEAQEKRYGERLAGKTEEYELHITTKSGNERVLEVRAAPLRRKDGEVVGSVGILLDVTDQRALQEQFLWSQKMEVAGRLAGGVAHDFNNLLTVISGYAAVLLQKLEPDAAERRPLSAIADATNSAYHLTQQLLALSRRQVVKNQVINLGHLVHDSRDLLDRLLGNTVELTLHEASSDTLIYGDPNQLQQVLLNLAVNAKDAMPKGGTLEISTHLDSTPREDSNAESHVVLKVKDSGTGMSEKVKQHIFEPFFTTKKRGTGLGLSTAFAILKEHSAVVQVDSREGKGTEFEIVFPLTKKKLSVLSKAAARPEHVHFDGYILVVEDEIEVRELVAELLENEGYRVLKAVDGADALRIFEKRAKVISFIVTDIVMPNMNGFEFVEQVLAKDSSMPILMMSACIQDSSVPESVARKGLPFLAKPFVPETLFACIDEIIQEKPDIMKRAV